MAKYAQAAFTVSATPLSPRSVGPGSSATSTVTIAPVNSFTGSVSLSCAIASGPSNAISPPSCLFATSPVTVTSGSVNSALTVSTTSTTSGGVYTIAVIGTDPLGMTHSTTVTLTVEAPNFTLTATAPAAVTPGSSPTSTVTLTSFDGYNSSVNLTCTVAGSGSPLPGCSVTGTNPLTPTAGGATSTVTITTTGPIGSAFRPRKIFYAMWLPVAGLLLLGIGIKNVPLAS